jgi:hypothetical protein
MAHHGHLEMMSRLRHLAHRPRNPHRLPAVLPLSSTTTAHQRHDIIILLPSPSPPLPLPLLLASYRLPAIHHHARTEESYQHPTRSPRQHQSTRPVSHPTLSPAISSHPHSRHATRSRPILPTAQASTNNPSVHRRSAPVLGGLAPSCSRRTTMALCRPVTSSPAPLHCNPRLSPRWSYAMARVSISSHGSAQTSITSPLPTPRSPRS